MQQQLLTALKPRYRQGAERVGATLSAAAVDPRATAVRWEDQVVEMDLTRDQVRSGPEYNHLRLGRDDEQLLHQHYQRSGSWENVLW